MTTRTVVLTGALVAGASLSGGLIAHATSANPDHSAYVSSDRSRAARCTAAAQTISAEWGVTGEWRQLAPFPFARDASPTASIGVWTERSRDDDGAIVLRKISALETTIVTIDSASCAVRSTHLSRRFNTDSMRGAFTDARLDSVVHATRRGMIYVWSPRMPYSVSGLEQAKQAATTLGIAFTAVVAETNDAELRTLSVAPEFTMRQESLELIYRNANIHYPAALFYDNGKIIDGVFPGYKAADTYAKFASQQFAASRKPRVPAASEASPAAPKFWVDRKAKVTSVSSVNTPRRIGFFFKPISGTDYVSYNSNSKDFFFNIKTSEEVPVPGHIDPVPTPDGRFLTLPGLMFFQVPQLLAGNQAPMHIDRTIPDEYQTASILSETAGNIRYRVVTGWNAGARFRDYDVALDKKKTPVSITPLEPAFAPCGDRLLTLPINAKSGTEFGAYDPATKTNLILEVTDPTHCKVNLDLGFASGKISFSYDGQSIALATSRINTDSEGELMRPSELSFKDALVLNRKTGRIVSLSQNQPINGQTFAEFLKDGTVMLLDQIGPGRPVERLRIVSYK